MSSINISTVQNKKELMKFIKFQWEIYKDDKHWVPPLIMERKKLLNKEKNPFFKHAEAEYFLAEKDGKLIGRIAAIKNDMHLKYHNDDTGFFGFFECIDSPPIASALFAKVEEAAREWGHNIVRGPFNPSVNEEIGLQIDAFDTPNFVMIRSEEHTSELQSH